MNLSYALAEDLRMGLVTREELEEQEDMIDEAEDHALHDMLNGGEKRIIQRRD